jgi:hypothetical protein
MSMRTIVRFFALVGPMATTTRTGSRVAPARDEPGAPAR